jgi:hypothetical protein
MADPPKIGTGSIDGPFLANRMPKGKNGMRVVSGEEGP